MVPATNLVTLFLAVFIAGVVGYLLGGRDSTSGAQIDELKKEIQELTVVAVRPQEGIKSIESGDSLVMEDIGVGAKIDDAEQGQFAAEERALSSENVLGEDGSDENASDEEVFGDPALARGVGGVVEGGADDEQEIAALKLRLVENYNFDPEKNYRLLFEKTALYARALR